MKRFEVGARVVEPTYGLGSVTAIEDAYTRVEFDEHGPKKFLTSLARFESSNSPAPASSKSKRKRKTAKTAKTASTKTATTKTAAKKTTAKKTAVKKTAAKKTKTTR